MTGPIDPSALGGTLAGPLTGYVLEHHGNGWAALFVLIGIETIISAAAWLFIDCRKPLDQEGAAS